MKVNVLRNRVKVIVLAVGVFVLGFYVHALGGLGASPIVFAEPPAFVDQYVMERYPSSTPVVSEQSTSSNLTKDYFNEAALVRNVIVNGEPTDELIRLFTHPDKAKRVRIAFALGEVNSKLSHDEGTDFDEKRVQFWLEVEDYSADIQNALFEALVVSAQERTRNFIPYTLAWWMKEQKAKAVEVLDWAAKHHPDPWVRSFSVFYVIQLASALIGDRTHDPVFRVRKRVLEQRKRRLKEAVFGVSD